MKLKECQWSYCRVESFWSVVHSQIHCTRHGYRFFTIAPLKSAMSSTNVNQNHWTWVCSTHSERHSLLHLKKEENRRAASRVSQGVDPSYQHVSTSNAAQLFFLSPILRCNKDWLPLCLQAHVITEIVVEFIYSICSEFFRVWPSLLFVYDSQGISFYGMIYTHFDFFFHLSRKCV